MQLDWKSAVFQSTRPRSKYLILLEISNHAVTISTYLPWHFRIRSQLFALHIFAFARSLAFSFKTYSHTHIQTHALSLCPNKINFSLEFAFSPFLCVMRKIPKPNHFFYCCCSCCYCCCTICMCMETEHRFHCLYYGFNFEFHFQFSGCSSSARAWNTKILYIFCSGNKVIVRKMCYTCSVCVCVSMSSMCEILFLVLSHFFHWILQKWILNVIDEGNREKNVPHFPRRRRRKIRNSYIRRIRTKEIGWRHRSANQMKWLNGNRFSPNILNSTLCHNTQCISI